MGVLKKYDFVCVNINCNDTLTSYEVGRQKVSRRYRFCKKCRSCNRELTWLCRSCHGYMTSSRNVYGKYYCNSRCTTKLVNS